MNTHVSILDSVSRSPLMTAVASAHGASSLCTDPTQLLSPTSPSFQTIDTHLYRSSSPNNNNNNNISNNNNHHLHNQPQRQNVYTNSPYLTPSPTAYYTNPKSPQCPVSSTTISKSSQHSPLHMAKSPAFNVPARSKSTNASPLMRAMGGSGPKSATPLLMGSGNVFEWSKSPDVVRTETYAQSIHTYVTVFGGFMDTFVLCATVSRCFALISSPLVWSV